MTTVEALQFFVSMISYACVLGVFVGMFLKVN